MSHFLLTWLLLPVIKRSGPGARIVNVSCDQHKKVKVNDQIICNRIHKRNIGYFSSLLRVHYFQFEPDNLFKEPIKYKKKFTYARYN